MEKRREKNDAFIRGYLSDRATDEITNKIPLKFSYPTNHLPEPTVERQIQKTCFLAAREG